MKYRDRVTIGEDFDPLVTIVEPSVQSCLMFADQLTKNVPNVQLFRPTTRKKGWISGLYRSGEAIVEEIGKQFYKTETDIFLFQPSSRVADAKNLMPGYFDPFPMAYYFQLGETVYGEGARDYASWFSFLANMTVCQRIYGGGPWYREFVERECQMFLNDSGETCLTGHLNQFGESIVDKFRVLPIGYDFRGIFHLAQLNRPPKVPTILWNHRIDFDCNPSMFARAIIWLCDQDVDFRVILTATERKNLPVWSAMKEKLGDRLIHKGQVESYTEYLKLVQTSDIVISTKEAEMFGYSIAEAVMIGSIPLVTDKGPYRAFYPSFNRFESEDELKRKLLSLVSLITNDGTRQLQQELNASRSYLINNHDWSIVRERYKTEFRDFWLTHMSQFDPKPTAKTLIASCAINSGPITKRDLFRNVLGWGGLDFAQSIRWKLLNAGYRTRTEGEDIVWYRP